MLERRAEKKQSRLRALYMESRTLYSDFDMEDIVSDIIGELRRTFGPEREEFFVPVIAVGWKEDPVGVPTDEQKEDRAERRRAESRSVEIRMLEDFAKAVQRDAARDEWLAKQACAK